MNEIINQVKVYNMRSTAGNRIPNQFVISTPQGTYFQSYNTIIAFIDVKGQVYLDESSWDCSVTTGKYRNQFLREGIAETRKKIKSGEYWLINLN